MYIYFLQQIFGTFEHFEEGKDEFTAEGLESFLEALLNTGRATREGFPKTLLDVSKRLRSVLEDNHLGTQVLKRWNM